MSGLVGKKIGMTTVFSSNGKLVPVTVIQVGPCVVTQVKTTQTDGYNALQLGFDEKPVGKICKPMAGHLKKSGEKGFKVLKEFRTDEVTDMVVGTVMNAQMFAVGDKVTITGVSKGRGFQGTIRRHGFGRGPESHGCRNHREPGSIGNSATPGRVFKGKKMPGHLGVDRKTIKNLTIVDIKPKDNLILVKGAVPGFKTGILEVKKTVK